MIHSLADWVGYWLVRAAMKLVQALPLETALGGARGVGQLLSFFDKRRRIAYANLKAAFPASPPQERKRWIHQMFQNISMTAVEVLRFPIFTESEAGRYVTHHGYDHYLKARQSGKGVILLTAHMGNWELSQVLEGIRRRPMTVLARKQKYPRLDGLLNSFRELHGSVSIGRGGGIRDLIRTLQEGGCVGVLGDQSGGDDGVWVHFFNRITTAPRGPMALALKLGLTVLPVFHLRRGPRHDIYIEPPMNLVRTGDREKDIRINTQNFIHILERYITQDPSQWLWGHKRWKRTRTKRIAVLSDGKPGHVKQSEALLKEILEKGRGARPPYEFQVEKIEVEFQSPWKKRLFSVFALFFLPFIQGRLGGLGFFLKPASADAIERTNPDLVISAGASLVPLNLLLGRENLSKSAVLMKPSFPFNLFRYDLALIPAHDQGILPQGSFQTQGVFSGFDSQALEDGREKLLPELRAPERIKFSLFLGGETRNFKFSLSEVENLITQLERLSQKKEADYLVTTSRRTPEAVSRFLRSRLAENSHCQLCVIGAEDGRREVVPGMMALADHLLVTEDSLSMISEALSSGKQVTLLKMSRNGLPAKHARFQEMLKNEWGVSVVEPARLCEAIEKADRISFGDRFERERSRIQEKVGGLF